MSNFLAKRLNVLKPYTPGEQPQDKSYIKLNTNESPYPPSPLVKQLLNGDAIDALRLYSDPHSRSLNKAIAEYHGISPEQVFTANGSDEVLSFAFYAWGQDNGVAYPDISYGFYRVFADLYGLCSVVVPLENDFSLDIAKFDKTAGLIVFANPNAPTGLFVDINKIEALAKSNPDSIILVDEAYVDFGGVSALSLIDSCNNVVVVRTFSKSRQLAGARLGYAMASENLIDDLNRVKFSFNPYNVNRLTALAGEASIKDDEWHKSCVNKVIATRGKLLESLKNLGFYVTDSKANFVFASHNSVPAEVLYLKLKEYGVLVRHFKQDKIDNFLRITVGTDDEINNLVGAICRILKEYDT